MRFCNWLFFIVFSPSEMDTWDVDECNQYVGTDSTIFPPFMSRDEGIWAYEPSICRSLGMSYKEPAKYNDLPMLRYELNLDDAGNNKECFCRAPGECPYKGTFDLFKCVGSPMIASQPHFYDSDQWLLSRIDGLSPNKEEHSCYLLFEIVGSINRCINSY